VGGVRGAGRPDVNAVAFACEISERRDKAAVVAAGREVDGTRLVVDLVWYDHPRSVVVRISKLVIDHDPVCVVVDPRSQAGTLLGPLAEAGVTAVQPGPAEVTVAHGEFLDLVNDHGLVHLDQAPLTAAVRAAQQRPLAGAQAWERRIQVDQAPLVAATLAAWGFRRWEELATPGAWVM
jgi:hypothetical protein